MATRKKRHVPQQFQAPQDNKPKKIYQDEFQTNVGSRVEDIGKQFEGKSRTILYALGALAALAVVAAIFLSYNRRTNAAAQTALGKAIETSQAQVTSSPQPAGSTAKTFKTEKERAEASIGEFQAVVDKFGGAVEDKAKYFIATNRLSIDRAAAVSELEALSKNSGGTGTLAKFAFAQAKAGDGKLDEAAALYRELAAQSDPILAKDTINYELAQILDKQGKKDEAADLYYAIAKTASEAKDTEGKPVAMTQTANDAKQKLAAINPDRAKEIIEPVPESPFGAMGGAMGSAQFGG